MNPLLMTEKKKDITINIIYDGQKYIVNTFTHEYRNLMVLLNNSIFLEGFGECGGQGRCATCMVRVTGLNGTANNMDRNENATIVKTGLVDVTVRLSCQLLINADLHEAVIEIVSE